MSTEGRRPFDFTPEELEAEIAYWGPKWRQYHQDHKDDPPYEPPSDHTTPDRYYPSPSPGPNPHPLLPAFNAAESIITRANGSWEPIVTRSAARVGTHFMELDNSPRGKARGSTFAYLVALEPPRNGYCGSPSAPQPPKPQSARKRSARAHYPGVKKRQKATATTSRVTNTYSRSNQHISMSRATSKGRVRNRAKKMQRLRPGD